MGATWGRHNSQISHVDHATTLIKPIKGERNRSSPAMLSFLYFLLLHIFFLSVPFYEIAPVLFSLCLAALTPYYHVPRVEGTDGHSPDHCPLENNIRYMTPNQTHRHQLHLSLTENTSTSTPKRAVSRWSCLLHEAICWTRTVYMFDTVHMFLPQCDVTWHGAMVDKAWCPETREDQTQRSFHQRFSGWT